MRRGAPGSFGAHLKSLRETAGFTQEELATIAGLSVHAVSALERGERRRPHVDTVRALSSALDLAGTGKDAFLTAARATPHTAADDLGIVPVPVPLTALLGRDAEIQQLREWLDTGRARLVTLTGTGGVGKTRLALELARGRRDADTTGVVFVSLAVISNAALVASAIAEAFGFSDIVVSDLPRRVRAACQERPTLLVLDNFEHVLDAAPLVADLLMTTPSLQVLVTSRAPLRLRGEREFAVGPLALDAASDDPTAVDLERSPAVRLFVERARDVQPEFRLTAANGPTVAAICRRLDSLPLALELAAPWIKMLTADGLLRRLEHDVLLSAAPMRDLPERQQTMNATVAWSYHLLEEDEQQAFRRLGALPGLFPIDAAAEVLAGAVPASDMEPALSLAARLIDKSLLTRSETSVVPTCPLYFMLETVRAYAALKLDAAGERDETREGLVRYCLNEVSVASTELTGPRQGEWLDRVREDLESYRAALSWLIERNRGAEASRIAWSLLFFWVIRGHGAEGLRWYEQIVELSVEDEARARALSGAGVMLYTQGEVARARTSMTDALSLARSAGVSDIVAEAQNLLGHIEHAAGNLDAARGWFERSVAAFTAMDVPWGVGNGLSGLAWIAMAEGDMTRAERLLDESDAALRDGGPWFLELGLYIRALIAVRRGNADAAVACVRESLTRIVELQDKFAFVYALVPLAAAAILKGDDPWAARILGARDAITERTGAALLDPSVRDLRARAERDARARLGPDQWGEAYAAGRRMSIEAVIKDIDSVMQR